MLHAGWLRFTLLILPVLWITSSAVQFNKYAKGLTEIPSNIPNDSTYINLNQNNISKLNPKRLPLRVKYFSITYNKLYEIQNFAFSSLNQLSELILSHNNIFYIGNEAFSGTALQVLELDHNKLILMPDLSAIGQTLKLLNLEGNLISEIKDNTFRNMSTLLELYLNNNSLQEYPNFSTAKRSLITLDMSLNEFDDELSFDYFEDFTRLKILALSYANQQLFPRIKPVCHTIETLALNGNEIKYIPDDALNGATSLKKLYLRDNKIQLFPNVSNLYMEQVVLSENKLCVVPLLNIQNFVQSMKDDHFLLDYESSFDITKDGNRHYTHTTIDVSHNNLTSFPDPKMANAFIHRLDIRYNSLICDCQLSWIKEGINSNRYPVHIQLNNHPCKEPLQLQAKAWEFISVDELICFNSSDGACGPYNMIIDHRLGPDGKTFFHPLGMKGYCMGAGGTAGVALGSLILGITGTLLAVFLTRKFRKRGEVTQAVQSLPNKSMVNESNLSNSQNDKVSENVYHVNSHVYINEDMYEDVETTDEPKDGDDYYENLGSYDMSSGLPPVYKTLN